jgi:signal transduction histidine kinase
MKLLNRKIFNGDFKTKVFIKFLILIIAISFSFTAIFIHHQRKFLTDTLIKEGLSLVKLLAYNSRLGVFSENPNFLKDPIQGVMQREGVLAVHVFTIDGRLLSSKGEPKKADTKKQEKILEMLKMSNSPFYSEEYAYFEFWAPIISGANELPKESLFHDTESFYKKTRVIGFVRIDISKKILSKNFKSLLSKGILIAIIFLMIGSIIAYLVAKSVTKPLDRLTEGVRAIGSGDLALQIPFETDDEIGKLAMAFNNMAESLREREAELRSLASQLSLTEERERRRIATELHDHIGQTLALCKIKLGMLQESASAGLLESMDEIRKLIDQTIQYTRSLTSELSPPILYELGFEATVEWLGEKILKQYGILFHFEDDGQPKPICDEARVLLFQAVRELLVNVTKHAQARNVRVSIRRDGKDVRINVEDDGVGFHASEIGSYISRTGFGLFSIRERLNYIGGYLEVESEPGHGTLVTLVAPMKIEKD